MNIMLETRVLRFNDIFSAIVNIGGAARIITFNSMGLRAGDGYIYFGPDVLFSLHSFALSYVPFRYTCTSIQMWREFDLILLSVGCSIFIAVYCFYFHLSVLFFSAICYFNILFARVSLRSLSLSLKMCVRRACIHQDMFVNISEPVVVGHKRFQTLISPFTTSNKGNIVHSVLYIRCVWHSRLLLLITASLSFFSSSLLVIPRLLAFVRSFDQESARWLLQQNSFAWWYLALA